jgi:hypothetical protein
MACGGSSHIVQTLLPFFDGSVLTSESVYQSLTDVIGSVKGSIFSKIPDASVCGLSVNRQVPDDFADGDKSINEP